jgi:hypothetical protein
MATFDATHHHDSSKHQDQLHASAQHELLQWQERTFFNSKVDLKSYLLLPSGLEIPLGILYIFLFPYAIGLLVTFLFIARHDFDSFLVLDPFTIIPIWAIGYEVSAVLFLVGVTFAALRFNYNKKRRIAFLQQILAIKRHNNSASTEVAHFS